MGFTLGTLQIRIEECVPGRKDPQQRRRAGIEAGPRHEN
jgi:hypothetical protein